MTYLCILLLRSGLDNSFGVTGRHKPCQLFSLTMSRNSLPFDFFFSSVVNDVNKVGKSRPSHTVNSPVMEGFHKVYEFD
jgi:hypothetical protein